MTADRLEHSSARDSACATDGRETIAMTYDKRCDCANSGKGTAPLPDHAQGDVITLTCTRCKQQVPATVDSDGRGTYWTHLRPGKTLADRR